MIELLILSLRVALMRRDWRKDCAEAQLDLAWISLSEGDFERFGSAMVLGWAVIAPGRPPRGLA